MVKIIYVEPSGRERAVDVPVGHSVMEGAIANGVEGIVAECGGACSCATCHAHVAEEWLPVVGKAAEDEQDMLEFASAVGENSRLTCQITVVPEHEGLRVHVAQEQG